MYESRTYSIVNESSTTEVWLVEDKNLNTCIEIRQTTGSVSIIQCKGVHPPPGTSFFSSGLMNRPVKIMDQWLLGIGAPTFAYIKKNAVEMEAPDIKVDHTRQSRGVHYIKEQIKSLQTCCDKSLKGTVFCCVRRTPELEPAYFVVLCDEWLATRESEEGDQRDFPEASDGNAVWEKEEKKLGDDVSIINEICFSSPHEKHEMLQECKLWLRRIMKC